MAFLAGRVRRRSILVFGPVMVRGWRLSLGIARETHRAKPTLGESQSDDLRSEAMPAPAEPTDAELRLVLAHLSIGPKHRPG